MFFAPTKTSQAKAKEFAERIFTRERDRDQKPTLAVRDAQAEAITDWAIPDMSKLGRLTGITQPALVANGSNDILVPTVNSYLLAGHIPDAQLTIYPDAGHGFLFQYPREFAAEVSKFLGAALKGTYARLHLHRGLDVTPGRLRSRQSRWPAAGAPELASRPGPGTG